jgi:hypothetical protein
MLVPRCFKYQALNCGYLGLIYAYPMQHDQQYDVCEGNNEFCPLALKDRKEDDCDVMEMQCVANDVRKSVK